MLDIIISVEFNNIQTFVTFFNCNLNNYKTARPEVPGSIPGWGDYGSFSFFGFPPGTPVSSHNLSLSKPITGKLINQSGLQSTRVGSNYNVDSKMDIFSVYFRVFTLCC